MPAETVGDEVAEVAVARHERKHLEQVRVARGTPLVLERGAEHIGRPHRLLRQDRLRAKTAVELDFVAQVGVVPRLERRRRGVRLEEDLLAVLVGGAERIGACSLVEELEKPVAVEGAGDQVAG